MRDLVIPAEAWEPIGQWNKWDRIVTQITINHIPFHLEGWRVNKRPEIKPYFQQAREGSDDLNTISEAVGGDGPFQTITIPGRGEYVLVASPHCD